MWLSKKGTWKRDKSNTWKWKRDKIISHLEAKQSIRVFGHFSRKMTLFHIPEIFLLGLRLDG